MTAAAHYEYVYCCKAQHSSFVNIYIKFSMTWWPKPVKCNFWTHAYENKKIAPLTDICKARTHKAPFTPPATHSDRATWSHSFSMESWRLPAAKATVTVGDGMWMCQAMRVKRQKLRIAQLYANERRISRATTNRSEEFVSAAHTSPSRVF